MHKSLFTFILSMLLLFSGNLLMSQESGMENYDLRTIKVDELSDRQIRQFVQRAEESGMTREQLEAAALARGMPPAELTKLRQRIAKLESKSATGKSTVSRLREYNLDDDQRDFDLFSTFEADTLMTPEERLQSRIFGYELFNVKELNFAPSMNIPTPKNYQLGAGDELIIDIWGASQQNYNLTVSPEGYILVDNLGPIHVSGLTMEEASKKIIGRLGNIYSGLQGSYPNTWANVSIGNVRSIQVSVIGEVNFPGTYSLSSLSTVFNALYFSGGPNINGSFRNIELIRNNKVYRTIDVYDFLLKGAQTDNVRLQDQDIIRVVPYETRVDFSGQVKRPGIYEVKNDEPLKEVIHFAGGFTDKAYSHRLKIYRKTSRQKKIIDLPVEAFESFILQNGDSIPVGKILPRFTNRVRIEGAVYRPGDYELNEGMMVSDLIEKAEGLKGNAFLPRAVMYRTKQNLEIEAISIDLSNYGTGNFNDIELHQDDYLKISSIFDLREEYQFEIFGEVKSPGAYPYIENASLEDIILMSGGLKESAASSNIEVARRITEGTDEDLTKIAHVYSFQVDKNLGLTGQAKNFVLSPFDQVFVRKSPGYEEQITATVSGEVMYPGQYTITTKTERVSDLIERAGGITAEAYLPGARLIRIFDIDEEERQKALENIVASTGDTLAEVDVETTREQSIGIDLIKIMENPGSKHDIILEEDDRLEIPKQLQTVRLTGALLYPNTTRYEDNRSLRNYISRAGGFTEDARRSKTYVIYANGAVKRTHKILFFNKFPRVEPGAEIIVPRKPERQGLSAQEWVGLTSVLSSTALVVVTIVNNLNGN